jgi:hypothetical protein
MQFRRFLALVLCVTMLSAGVVAMASEREEIVSSEYVPITGTYCVVDSLYGVDAIYSTNTGYFQCWEYITRFYKTVYGITVGYDGAEKPVSSNSAYTFVKTETPRPGDIAFASAARRGTYNHWAIVKSYDAESGTITLIEQNFQWNGSAETNRTLTFPSSYYEVFTLTGANGPVQPIIDVTKYQSTAATDETTTEETAAQQALETAAQELTITGTYSSYVLPYAKEAISLGMNIRLENYTKAVDAETFFGLIIETLKASDYEFRYEHDLAEGETSSLAIAYAMGIADENLLTNPTITREEAAVIMQRLVNYLGVSVTYDLTDVAEFVDFQSINSKAVDSIAQMMKMEIMGASTVNGQNTFRPKANMTYEQALTMVMRLYNYVPEVIVSSVVTAEAGAATTADLSGLLPTE